jgi:hypothetical protein
MDWQILIASLPESLIMPIAPMPCAVAGAAMVSFIIMLILQIKAFRLLFSIYLLPVFIFKP